jgi:cell division protein YceG involved in septum cleavage
MFFVADGQGGHTFSVTLEEHNEAVQRLLGQAGRQQEDP